MSRVRVQCFGVSLDGFGAGPRQDLQHPLGVGGEGIMAWAFPTRTLQRMVFGKADGTTGIDDRFAARGFENIGAWILGRNMFAPSRGAWPDDGWKGWWGEEPAYHVPTFILTHHAQPPIEMKGGTIFHFVTGGIREALDRAREAARGQDVRIGGGASTIRQYLQAGLVDEMHLVVSPVLLGSGENLLSGIDLPALGFKPTERVTSETVLHTVLTRASR
jgi:dihydrofolate reductase